MPLLELRNISRHFGAIRALDDVSLSLEEGEIVGLLGDNGAGKSTLVKIIAGNHPPSAGEYLLNGKPVHLSDPAQARHEGVDVVYQDLALCDNLSSSANVFLGRELMKGIWPFRVLVCPARAGRRGARRRRCNRRGRGRGECGGRRRCRGCT